MGLAVEVVALPALVALEAPVARLAEAALEAENVTEAVVVAFVDEEAMAKLNNRYRGVDEPTDVLSFGYAGEAGMAAGVAEVAKDAEDAKAGAWPARSAQLGSSVWPGGETGTPGGEIALCLPVIRRYSEEEGDDPGRRLAWTIVHGVLHLAGHDHETDDGEMRVREQELLLDLEESVSAVSAALGS